ncbi:MAG: S8 family serine peptidase [Bdellovibrionales bacterium]|nr:S8 family serine peptidase [Bdellovibrionales bacterium]
MGISLFLLGGLITFFIVVMGWGTFDHFRFTFGGIMNNHGRFILLLGALLVFCSHQAWAGLPQAVPGEYVVKLKADISKVSMTMVTKSFQADFSRPISQVSNTVLIKRSMLDRTEAVVAQLKRHPLVEIIEPNYIYHASVLPNDARLSDLWGLRNQQKSGIDIGAEAAWDITTGSRDIVVAVIDSGVDYTIADLQNNMWVNEAEKNGTAGVDDDGNGFVDDIYGYDFANSDGDPMDDNNHGSHCAGTIGAEGNNGEGVVGVNWQVKIMALKFLTGSGSGTLEAALQAIDYAVANGAKILSNSWGGGGFSQNLYDAIERAKDAGVLFVAAAGNSGANNDSTDAYPANYELDNVISVAAIDSNGNLASFSSYGKKKVHIAAPGVDILSTTPQGLKYFDGTSMATPHVSGVAALLLSSEPLLDYAQIKDRLMATSHRLSNLKSKTISGGIVNAYNALTNTVPPPDPNDPANWEKAPFTAASPHPYDNNFSNTYTLTVPGAAKVAAHFSKFDTENRYDKVIVKDSSGNVYATLTGSLDDIYTPVVDGETVILEFSSDGSITRYGFDVDHVAYIEPN